MVLVTARAPKSAVKNAKPLAHQLNWTKLYLSENKPKINIWNKPNVLESKIKIGFKANFVAYAIIWKY